VEIKIKKKLSQIFSLYRWHSYFEAYEDAVENGPFFNDITGEIFATLITNGKLPLSCVFQPDIMGAIPEFGSQSKLVKSFIDSLRKLDKV